MYIHNPFIILIVEFVFEPLNDDDVLVFFSFVFVFLNITPRILSPLTVTDESAPERAQRL